MGHKFSAIHGVKSDNFYQQGNAINEIWIGDLELIARLPFGDSDLGQAGWPLKNWPKIPWHQFVIPLKRDMNPYNTTLLSTNDTELCSCMCNNSLVGPFVPSESPLYVHTALFWGILVTVMASGILFSLYVSDWTSSLMNAMRAARKLDPIGARAWMETIVGTPPRSSFAVTLHYLQPVVVLWVACCLILAGGVTLLHLAKDQFIRTDTIVGLVSYVGFIVAMSGIMLFCFHLMFMMWTQRSLRKKIEHLGTVEDDLKSTFEDPTSDPEALQKE